LNAVFEGDVTITTAGDTSAGGTGSIWVDSRAFILGTNVATSTSTGALVVTGGVGIGGSQYIGTNLEVQNNTSLIGTLDVTGNATYASTSTVVLLNTTTSTSATSGALQVTGGVGIGKELYVLEDARVAGILRALNTTNSTGTATGSLVVAGGVGIAKDVFIGQNLDVTQTATIRSDLSIQQNLTALGGTITITNATGATSTSTGALVVTGGVAIQENLYVNGDHYVNGSLIITNTNNSTSTNTGALQIRGGVGIAKNLYVGELVRFISTEESTSPTTGALVVTGGMGVGDDVNFGGIVTWAGTVRSAIATTTFTDTTESTSATSGAIVVDGGVGIQKSLFIGGTNDSTSATTGALVVAGGAGIGKDLSIGGGDVLLTNGTVAGNQIHFNTLNNNVDLRVIDGAVEGDVSLFDVTGTAPILGWFRATNKLVFSTASGLYEFAGTQNSTSTSTGAVVISGGVGIAKNIYGGGEFALTNNTLGALLNSANAPLITRGTDPFTSGAYNTAGRWGLFLEPSALTAGIPSGVTPAKFQVGTYLANSTVDKSWFTIDGPTGVTAITSTVGSTSTSTGALTVAGGVGIGENLYVNGLGQFGTINATGNTTFSGIVTITNTTQSNACGNGALVVYGGLGVEKNLNVCGDTLLSLTLTTLGVAEFQSRVNIINTEQSSSTTTGALVVSGGLAVAKNTWIGGSLNLTGNAVIGGNLLVQGSTTTINSTTLEIADNVALVKAGPADTSDAGYGMKRYQDANDTGSGDVVSTMAYYSGTARTGSTATTIVLDTGASAVNDFYKDMWISITGGTGVNQVRRIKTYNGTTKVATLYSTADQAAADPQPVPVEGMDWTTIPDATSTFSLYGSQYIVTFWEESEDRYKIGYTPLNPTNNVNINVLGTIDVQMGSVYIDGTAYVDTINERTLNNGVTIEGVNIRDGALTNVVSINNIPADVATTISLIDNTVDRVVIPGTTANGTFQVMVQAVNNSGSMAVFVICASGNRAGVVNKIVSSRGTNFESIEVEWLPGSAPRFRHGLNILGASGASLQYYVRTIRVV